MLKYGTSKIVGYTVITITFSKLRY